MAFTRVAGLVLGENSNPSAHAECAFRMSLHQEERFEHIDSWTLVWRGEGECPCVQSASFRPLLVRRWPWGEVLVEEAGATFRHAKPFWSENHRAAWSG